MYTRPHIHIYIYTCVIYHDCTGLCISFSNLFLFLYFYYVFLNYTPPLVIFFSPTLSPSLCVSLFLSLSLVHVHVWICYSTNYLIQCTLHVMYIWKFFFCVLATCLLYSGRIPVAFSFVKDLLIYCCII